MSYDIYLADPATHEPLELEAAHHMRGGTYAMGGTTGKIIRGYGSSNSNGKKGRK